MIKTIYDASTYPKDDKKIIFLVDLKKKVKKTSLEKLPNPDDPYLAVVAIPTCRKSRRDNIRFLSKI